MSSMKIFEVLSFHGELLRRLSAAGVRQGDYRYLDLYRDYHELVARGEKVTYAVSVTATRHAVSERHVYNIVRRFDSEICTDCTHSAVG